MSNSGIWGWFCAAVVIIVTVVMIYTGVFRVTINDTEYITIDETNQTIKIDVVDDGVTIDSTTGDTVAGLEGVDDTLETISIKGVSGYANISTDNHVAIDADNYIVIQLLSNYDDYISNTSPWTDFKGASGYDGSLLLLSRNDYLLSDNGTLIPRRTDVLYDVSSVHGVVLLYAISYDANNNVLECNNGLDNYTSVSNDSVVSVGNNYYLVTYDNFLRCASIIVKSVLLNDSCTDNTLVHNVKLYLNNLADNIQQYDASTKSWIDINANFVVSYQYGHQCYWDKSASLSTVAGLVTVDNANHNVFLRIEY